MAGYDADFLTGVTVPMPEPLPAVRDTSFLAGAPIDHTHHSIVFSQARGLAVFAAHNADGARHVSGIKRRRFTFDPKVPKRLQIDDDRGYRGIPSAEDNPWDAGHLARRKDVHWPSEVTAKKAEKDTAHWTNIAPQHSALNRGPWVRIEDWLLGLAVDSDRRMCVFTGPVFTDTDMPWLNAPGEVGIRIPSGYWKVAVLRSGDRLVSAAFLIWQTDTDPEVTDYDPDDFDPVLEQVRVLTIEHLAGLAFPQVVRDADPLRYGQPPLLGPAGAGTLGEIREPEDINL